MKSKCTPKDETKHAAKRAQLAEEPATSEDYGGQVFADEIIVDDHPEYVPKSCPAALAALDEFVSNRLVARVLLDSASRSVREALLKVFRSKAKGACLTVRAAEMTSIVDVLRRAAMLSFRTAVNAIEGEVVDIRVLRDANESVQEIELTMRTSKATKAVRLSRQMQEGVANVNIGDVVYIEPTAGLIKRLGRSESRSNEFDLEGDKYVQLSRGGVSMRKERTTLVSLHDMDYAFNKYNEDISVFSRAAVDSVVGEYLQAGTVSLVPSYLVVEDFHELSSAQARTLETCLDALPWVKVLLAGDAARSSTFAGFLRIVANDPEDPLDVLRACHGCLAEDAFAGAVRKYLGLASMELISSALEMSSTVGEFTSIMDTQVVLK